MSSPNSKKKAKAKKPRNDLDFETKLAMSSRPHKNESAGHQESFHLSRSMASLGPEFGLQDADFGITSRPSTTSGFGITSRPSTTSGLTTLSPGKIGRHADERVQKREERCSSPTSELAVREIMRTSSFRHRSPSPPQRLSSAAADDARVLRSSHSRSRPSHSGHSLLSTKLDASTTVTKPQTPLQRVPNARLGAEVAISDQSLLGSSQVKGCQGDFCHFNVHSMDGKSIPKMDKKRKGLPVKVDYKKALFQAGLLDSSIDSTDESLSADHRICLKSIIQARQEMPLVKLQLERHMRGEDGPYVMQDSYQDITVKGKLPAHYYDEVPVCANCFQVYSIVDAARSKSLKQLEYKADERRARSRQAALPNDDASESSEQWQNESLLDGDSDMRDVIEDSFTKHQEQQLMNLQPSKRSSQRAMTMGLDTDSSSFGRGDSQQKLSNKKSEGKEDSAAEQANMQAALEAIDGLTKMDVAEIRTMIKPPAAVEVVIEAMMILLTGKFMTFKESYRLLSGGDSFLVMLKDFQLSDVTEERLRMVEVYVDNPLFRPENVLPVSYCASKFCAWVHGIVHAARYRRGWTHQRTDAIQSVAKTMRSVHQPNPVDNAALATKSYLKPLKNAGQVAVPASRLAGQSSTNQLSGSVGSAQEELSFVQKLEKMKANKMKDVGRIGRDNAPLSSSLKGKGSNNTLKKQSQLQEGSQVLGEGSMVASSSVQSMPRDLLARTTNRLDPRPAPSLQEASITMLEPSTESTQKKTLSKRDQKAMKAMQDKATDRLSAQTSIEGSLGVVGQPKQFRCSDGLTTMPYVVMGKFSMMVEKVNFIVIHDFFDTYDGTAIAFKPIVQRHDDGCQVLCFNYPGQAHTTWPRPSVAERERGAKDAVLNNDFIADRIQEMLIYAEESGDILLSKPFHLVGIGNGSCIAAVFAQRFGNSSRYRNSLRSVVSINGFLYPDAQLASILHGAHQVFENTPHNRPDIAVSYWCRYVFSEDYLRKVNPNLALNIYTAVSNPITNDGRARITRGSLAHKDMKGALAPDFGPLRNNNHSESSTSVQNAVNKFTPLQVPVVVLQSTEDLLVNASNVDSFLIGRTSKHLWSHMLNVPSEYLKSQAFDVNAQWVGKMSHGPEDYLKYSTLGKPGVKMLLDSLRNPRGAFVMWVRTGHAVNQEYKPAFLDLLDVLACPVDEYLGMDLVDEETQTITAAAKPSFGVIGEDPVRNRTAKASVTTTTTAGAAATAAPLSASVANNNRDALFVLKLRADEDAVDGKPTSSRQEAPVPPPRDLDSAIESILQSALPSRPQRTNVEEEVEELEETKSTHSEVNKPTLTPVPLTERSTGSLSVEIPVDVASSKALDNNDQDKDKDKDDGSVVSHLTRDGSVIDEIPAVLPTPPVRSPTKKSSPEKNFESKLRQHGSLSPNEEKIESIDDYWQHPEVAQHQPLLHALAPGHSSTMGTSRAVDDSDKFVSNHAQRSQHGWVSNVPDLPATLALEAELREKQREYQELEAKLNALREQQPSDSSQPQSLTSKEQKEAANRQAAEDKDRQLLDHLANELENRQKEREFSERQRRLQTQELDAHLVRSGLLPEFNGTISAIDSSSKPIGHDDEDSNAMRKPVMELPPMHYSEPQPLPKTITEGRDMVSQLDQMTRDEAELRRRGGGLTMEDMDRIKAQMAERQLQRDQRLRHLSDEELALVQYDSATSIARVIRGFLGRRRFRRLDAQRKLEREQRKRILYIQAGARGFLGRRRYRRLRNIFLQNMKGQYSATSIQRVFRGYIDRGRFRRIRRWKAAINIQRVMRGRLARMAANIERKRLAMLRRKVLSATRIQSLWRMVVAREEFRSLRIHQLAALELQRAYRGYIGRKKMARKRLWESTKPGPERIKLGLQFIEESKQAFERQQEEIDTLHRAQERAETRISHIHAELKESEKELLVLERELQEIDQIERDLSVLTHERQLLTMGMEDAAGMPHTAMHSNHSDIVRGLESTHITDPVLERRRKAEAYALEMTIQLKRTEREKKRQELEVEFAAVFQEVEKKKKALQRLELSLADMEATRERKDREFKRLQRNLMQLLLEQKQELDELREKGLELETASATTAAAAVATAQKAKEHEKRSNAMFSQTEELMKFQFMSMSLSYFSSLNMLKSLRDMNADTTSAAIALSAEASSTAAAAASAANLPSVKKLTLGANDFVEASIRKKKEELLASEKAQQEFKAAAAAPLPPNVRTWTVTDVARWLDSLTLSQYIPAFTEGSVDGPFLMELREDDLVQVLGIRHKLHVRKILVSREKLKPLSQQEQVKKEFVENEEQALAARNDMGVPSLDTVFSQARNGRIKRVEESLNLGFPIDAEDEKGNTLLLLACQNRNKRLVEMLLLRGAAINHQNAMGNTALHYAIAFDTEGVLAEYLIERGADDSIENINGLTPYDGCA